MTSSIYSWQQSQFEQLWQMQVNNKLPHALLFTGPQGTGKCDFARQFAKSLLCTANEAAACGQCAACQLFEAETHPDFRVVAPADDNKTINVDEIRQLSELLSKTSQFGGYSIVIIEQAERMNRNAANALLKTLEEPTDNTILMLITSQMSRLLPTIRSRCVDMRFPIPATDQSLEYLQSHDVQDAGLVLQLAHGSPLRARQLADVELSEQRDTLLKALMEASAGQAVSTAAKAIEKIPQRQILDWFIDLCDDLIRLKIQGETAIITNQDIASGLKQLASKGHTQRLYALLDTLFERKRHMNIALNVQLLLEDLLVLWKQVFE